MYEEDRQYAIGMYERMFDIAEDDEQWLIQHLMSPTRQAVVIARAYDAKERKLSVSAQSKDEDNYEDEEGTPPFVLAINKIFDDLFPEDEEQKEPVDDQVSFFELGAIGEETDSKKPKMPKAAVLLGSTQEFDLDLDNLPDSEDITAEDSEETEPERDAEPEEPGETVPERHDSDETDGPKYERFTLEDFLMEDDGTEQTDEADAERAVTETGDSEGETPAEEPELPPETEAETEAEPVETVQTDDKTEPDKSEADLPEEENKETLPETTDSQTEETAVDKAAVVDLPDRPIPETIQKKQPVTAVRTERVMNVPLLVLFLVVAIPVTLALVAFLLALTVASLGVAVGLCALGAVLVVSAFSGFAVFADILLLLGAAVAMLALGLFFLWLGVWLVGSCLVELIGAVRALAERWCSKEVPAE